MSAKTEREEMIRRGDPTAAHSLNQQRMKYVLDGRKKFSGTDKKAAKAEGRRWKQEQFLQDLPKFQFDRALGKMFNGMPIQDVTDLVPESIKYVLGNIDKHERTIPTFKPENGTKVPITIVDFTRPVV